MRRLIAYLTALILAVSCVTELEQGGTFVDGSLEGAPVTITFSVPDIPVLPASKAMDGSIGDITSTPYLDPDMMYLVVCGGTQSVKYIRKAEWIDTDEDYVVPENKYPLPEGDRHVTLHRFKVQLELSDSPRTVHILGNVDENQLITGSYAYNSLPNMLSYDNKQAYWQKIYVPHIKADIDQETQKPIKLSDGSYKPDDESLGYFQDIPLIRNYAKIQVTNAAENFELHSYAVIFAPEKGSVVPYRSNETVKENRFDFNPPSGSLFSGYESTTFDELDTEINYLGNMPASVALSKDIPAAAEFEDPDNNSINGRVILYNPEDTDKGFYIYERGIPNEKVGPTFIIICGKFESDDNWYYYRLDFMESKVEGTQTISKYYPIYRNFRYNIQLHRISSEGVLTPEAAANSSGVEDISADFSMRHLTDISNGTTRLVVEPFMTRTYSGPSDDGEHYELYARFFNNVNSNEPNLLKGVVRVELEPMSDGSDDILILYDDNGNRVPKKGAFYPKAATVGDVEGIRTIRFDTVEPLEETKTQKIKITGHKTGNHQDLRLYREVEITLQKKQPLEVTCTNTVQAAAGEPVRVDITIPAELPESMFPVEFIVEPEDRTLTQDTSKDINMPVVSGRSIASNESAFIDKPAFYYIRTLTWEEFTNITPDGDKRTFNCFFKTNRDFNATTVWVYNEYFTKDSDSFINKLPLTLSCTDPVLAVKDTPITLALTIHSQIPESYFPLDFIVEPEAMTIYPDPSQDVEMTEQEGSSIVTDAATVHQFIRTLTWDEFTNITPVGNQRTFYCYFKTNVAQSATKIWAYNEHFSKASVSFENEQVIPVNHFWVKAVENCTIKIRNANNSGIQYKIDDGTWMNYSSVASTGIVLSSDQKVSIKAGSNASKKTWSSGSASISGTGGKFKIGGNFASLVVGDDYEAPVESIKDLAFIDFFKAQTLLIDASELELPMMTLALNAYKSMFDSCTNLVSGPQILPATNLGTTCYRNMFYNCSSLENAPVLPATTLVSGCYQRMFYGCSKLNRITMLGTNWRSDAFISTESAVNPYSGNKTYKWCDGVASEGVINMNPDIQSASNWFTTWATIIPTGNWTPAFE